LQAPQIATSALPPQHSPFQQPLSQQIQYQQPLYQQTSVPVDTRFINTEPHIQPQHTPAVVGESGLLQEFQAMCKKFGYSKVLASDAPAETLIALHTEGKKYANKKVSCAALCLVCTNSSNRTKLPEDKKVLQPEGGSKSSDERSEEKDNDEEPLANYICKQSLGVVGEYTSVSINRGYLFVQTCLHIFVCLHIFQNVFTRFKNVFARFACFFFNFFF